ncbi:transporter, cation channel family protein [Plesiocystis pacifica SIR-1]|uniref:Transporter, cation channel family protein n=1 Tax=Plesiocystis pacifica SIR-1 TaxID=391625 RepID=A6FXN9_9BACT|nr:ion transporter [Plesiocystis pacifica]EDM81627.1 transporter, cation channel family protein [Plesiocystis pacifica SIR-1]
MRIFDPESRPSEGWRAKVYEIIFETDTPMGLLFDVLLLGAILLSIIAISLETVPTIASHYRFGLRTLEWVLTALFTIEYALRLASVKDTRRYALSFMGIVDLLSLLPTYLSLFFDQAQALQVIRALRLLRVFRVFQFGTMLNEGSALFRGLIAARYKIAVFLGTVMIIVVIQGALLYYLEHDENEGFSSIPRAIYWAIVTLTTVGYGDISPQTTGGQFIASLLMLLGYGIIAVPTGLVSAEIAISEFAARTELHDEVAELPSQHPNACLGPVPARLLVGGPVDERNRAPVASWVQPEPKPEPAPELDPEPEPEPSEPAPTPEPEVPETDEQEDPP